MDSTRVCSIEDCERAVHKRGWCIAHYNRWLRHGTTELLSRQGSKYAPPLICSVEGCCRKVKARDFCSAHYRRWRKGHDMTTPLALRQPATCTIAGCLRPARTHGWCDLHFQRWKRNGDPTKTVRRPYGTGTIDASGYLRVSRNGAQINLQRVVMEKMLDRPLRSDEIVHHKNGDKLDNRPENLVVVTRSEHAKIHAQLRK